jgi:hypothetical protein
VPASAREAIVWPFAQHRVETATRIISHAADHFAAGDQELSVDVVLTVFLRVLAADVAQWAPSFHQGSGTIWHGVWGFPDLPARPLEEWAKDNVPARLWLERLSADASADQLRTCESALRAVLDNARSQWSLGDPETPETTAVADALARVLFDTGFCAWWDPRGVRP